MNLVPVSSTTPLPEIPREPGDSSLPEVAEDFANMLSLISLAPVTLAQPQQPVPTPAPNSTEVTPIQSDASQRTIDSQIVPKPLNVADAFPASEESGELIPSPAPPLQSSADSQIGPETGSTQPLTLPDVARRNTPLPNSTTLDEADVFGRTLPTHNEPPLLDPTDIKRTTVPVEPTPVATAPVELPSPITEEPKKVSDTPSTSATAPVSLRETVTPVLTSPVPSEQNQGSRIETISPKTAPPEIKPDPKPIAIVTPDLKPTTVITAGASKPEVLVNETTQREANIAASYLAEGTRERGEPSPIAVLKLQLSTNGFGAESQQNEPDQQQAAANKDVRGVEFQPLKMTTTANVVTREGINESPVTQTVSHILQLAEATPPKQSRTVRLRLRPEELGQVDVQLSRDSQGRISARLTVEHDNARAVLAQSLEQLRDSLQRAGLEVDRLQVRAEVSSFSSGQGTNQRSQEESRVYQSSSLANSNASTETHAPQAKRVNDHKLISLSA